MRKLTHRLKKSRPAQWLERIARDIIILTRSGQEFALDNYRCLEILGECGFRRR
jgi:hypothetical protein